MRLLLPTPGQLHRLCPSRKGKAASVLPASPLQPTINPCGVERVVGEVEVAQMPSVVEMLAYLMLRPGEVDAGTR